LSPVKFDYGDAVVVTGDVGSKPHAGRACAVVSITPIDTDTQSQIHGYPIGTTMYTVEFGDGKDAIFPEEHLRPFESSTNEPS